MRIHLVLVVVLACYQAACGRTGTSDDRPKIAAAVTPGGSNTGIQSDTTTNGTANEENRSTTANQDSGNPLASEGSVGSASTDKQTTTPAITQLQPTDGLGSSLSATDSVEKPATETTNPSNGINFFNWSKTPTETTNTQTNTQTTTPQSLTNLWSGSSTSSSSSDTTSSTPTTSSSTSSDPTSTTSSSTASNDTSATTTTADASSACGTDCSGKGTCQKHGTVAVCACEKGFTPSSSKGDDCVPTTQVCKGGEINYDVDGDGVKEQFFEPSETECRGYELVNYTRATHDDEGTPESHTPLAYNLIWSAHARNHSKQMSERGSLFHADHNGGQNCASRTTPDRQISMYMTGPSEPHCSELSHHCNIMRPRFRTVGIGNWPIEGTGYNTQNFN